MSNEEIALQLTLKMIEHGYISKILGPLGVDESHCTEKVYESYNKILRNLITKP